MKQRAIFIDDALPPAEVDDLRRAVLSSKLLGDSPLGGTFTATRGFSVTFHRTQRAQVEARFGFLAPFLRLALDDARTRAVQRRPWFGGPPAPNACYLNVLSVPPGAAVGRHVDATLGPPDGSIVPEAVSVLYLDVPEDLRGGALVLSRGDVRVREIAPRTGRYVAFDGRLAHEVTTVSGSRARLSVVCEQYALSPGVLSAVPALKVQSRGFERVLDGLRRGLSPAGS